MNAADYNRYVDFFNGRDYDAVFDFYAASAELNFFGITIKNREEFKSFYQFLHQYVVETITVTKFASSQELAAAEVIVRVEAIKDLDAKTLEENGMSQFHPLKCGETLAMEQYVHYHLEGGKIKSVGCAFSS